MCRTDDGRLWLEDVRMPMPFRYIAANADQDASQRKGDASPTAVKPNTKYSNFIALQTVFPFFLSSALIFGQFGVTTRSLGSIMLLTFAANIWNVFREPSLGSRSRSRHKKHAENTNIDAVLAVAIQKHGTFI